MQVPVYLYQTLSQTECYCEVQGVGQCFRELPFYFCGGGQNITPEAITFWRGMCGEQINFVVHALNINKSCGTNCSMGMMSLPKSPMAAQGGGPPLNTHVYYIPLIREVSRV